MNRYALAADSHRWWWRPAAAGVVAVAATATVVALPVAGQAIPVTPDRTSPPPVSVRTEQPTAGVDHPCFLYRARWNDALDGPQPVCSTDVRLTGPAVVAVIDLVADAAPDQSTGVIRTWLDTRP
jgi:hypothetical protein